jgi:hypothetical protein
MGRDESGGMELSYTRLIVVTIIFLLLYLAATFWLGPAMAQEDPDASVFDSFLSPAADDCVPLKAIAKVATIQKLNNDQFQFVRAIYVAIPPISRGLPPGDRAIMATHGGAALLAVVTDGPGGEETCARFAAPDFIQKILAQVGRGENGQLGSPL